MTGALGGAGGGPQTWLASEQASSARHQLLWGDWLSPCCGLLPLSSPPTISTRQPAAALKQPERQLHDWAAPASPV